MKTFVLSILAIFVLSSFSTLTINNDQSQENVCYDIQPNFQIGEKLTYKIYYNWTAIWMSAGKVTFTVDQTHLNDTDVYHMTGTGRSAPAFDPFFKVRDNYETYMDKNTGKPIKFIRDIQEGGYKKNNLYTFDRENNEAYIHYIKRQGNTDRADEVEPINECTHDILSAIYYTRTLSSENLYEGQIIPVETFIDGKIYNTYLRYLGKDILKHKRVKYNCMKFSLNTIEGDVFSDGEDLIMWVTDDKNHLPLLLESKLLVGSIKGYLVNFENLKYDMDSKIKK